MPLNRMLLPAQTKWAVSPAGSRQLVSVAMPTARSVVLVALVTTLGHAAAPVVPVLAWVTAGVILSTVVGTLGHTLATCVNVLLAPLAAAVSPSTAHSLLVEDQTYATALGVIAGAIIGKAALATIYGRLPWRINVPMLWTRTDSTGSTDTTEKEGTGMTQTIDTMSVSETTATDLDPGNPGETSWDQIMNGLELVATGLRQVAVDLESPDGLTPPRVAAAAGVAYNIHMAEDIASQLKAIAILSKEHSDKYDLT